MKIQILDLFTESTAKCYLVKSTLEEYIKSLPEDYKDFEVQRGIVKNTYLDKLVDSILYKRHIPPIVLIYEKEIHAGDLKAEIEAFKILDGLQRTYRLKIIYETTKLFFHLLTQNSDILEKKRIQLSRTYKSELEAINSNSLILSKIIEFANANGGANVQNNFFETYQWFEIWTGLEAEEEVDKMLVLNAGHKPVKTQHQIELLFRYVLPLLVNSMGNEIKLLKEKEISSASFSKERQVGQYHFSHLITALLSFFEGKPITGNVTLIQKAQNEYYADQLFDGMMQYEVLNKFVVLIFELDKRLTALFKNQGTKWIGRETSLVGLFAAAGLIMEKNGLTPIDALNKIEDKILNNAEILDIPGYEAQRNNQNLAKINIGSVNKGAVYQAVYAVLTEKVTKINWGNFFNGESYA